MHPTRPATILRRLLGGLLAVALALGPVAPALAALLMDCCAEGMHADGHAGVDHAGASAQALEAAGTDKVTSPCHGDGTVADTHADAPDDAPCAGHDGGCQAGCMIACAATPLGPALPAATPALRVVPVLIAAVPAQAPAAPHQRALRPPISG